MKTWTSLRQEIEAICREFEIPESDFKPIGINQWKDYQIKFEENFVIRRHYTSSFNWYWESFNQESFSIQFRRNPYPVLNELIESKENLVFFINDRIHERSKFWFYKAKIGAIQKIIEESFDVDEYYICSEKMDWVLCVNHHDYLIAAGEPMITLLEKFKQDSRNRLSAVNQEPLFYE